jgi:uncharacterized protein YggU (UPF0235/DUF167 family)
VPRQAVTVEQGELSRQKRVRIRAPRALPTELGIDAAEHGRPGGASRKP